MIHSTAIISGNNVSIGNDVSIGPYSVIGDNVSIGPKTVIGAHVIIEGPTIIGNHCRIFHHCSIGTEPQDITHKGEETKLKIGNANIIREFCYINRGTINSPEKQTIIGNNNYLMGYSHIAHDCVLKDNIIMANSANLAGHVHIDSHCFIGGLTGIHQFCKVGAYTMIGGASAITENVLPYTMVLGNRAKAKKVNTVGLERNKFSSERIAVIKEAFDTIYKSKYMLSDAMRLLVEKFPDSEDVKYLAEFIQKCGNRGIVKLLQREEK